MESGSPMNSFYETKVSPAMRESKHLDFQWALKSIDESGVFAGYASVFSIVDDQHDMILPGAFTETLLRPVSAIKLLWQHDIKEPIGQIEELREDENGLYIKGRLLLDISRAREAYTLLRQGVLSGLSIGYSPLRYDYDPVSNVRLLKQVDLWEISLVTFPANTAARITVVKYNDEDERAWAEAVRTGQAIALFETFEKAEAVLLS
ncbi:MAG: HK97 family phage prohead protease [Rickettsiales bacterium]